MKYLKLLLQIIGLSIIGVIIGFTINSFQAPHYPLNDQTTTNLAPSHFEMVYGYIAPEDMIKQADVILVGHVMSIGDTKWNQDNGMFWEETIKHESGETTIGALPYFEITISPEQMIVDLIGIQDLVNVTIIGTSPVDFAVTDTGLNLKSGDEIIVFVRQSEIAWWDGKAVYDKEIGSFDSGSRKSVLMFMGDPNFSYMLKGHDGMYQFKENHTSYSNAYPNPSTLDDIIKLIQKLRSTP